MRDLRLQRRLARVENKLHSIVLHLPNETDLQRHMRTFPEESPLAIANQWWPVILRQLRKRDRSAPPTLQDVASYLSRLAGRPIRFRPGDVSAFEAISGVPGEEESGISLVQIQELEARHGGDAVLVQAEYDRYQDSPRGGRSSSEGPKRERASVSTVFCEGPPVQTMDRQIVKD